MTPRPGGHGHCSEPWWGSRWALLAPPVAGRCPPTRVRPGGQRRAGTSHAPGADRLSAPQAHIYSLGATLKAALEYVTEPEPEPRLSRDLEELLSQMQAEDPRDRPDLEVNSGGPSPPATPRRRPEGPAHTRGPRVSPLRVAALLRPGLGATSPFA